MPAASGSFESGWSGRGNHGWRRGGWPRPSKTITADRAKRERRWRKARLKRPTELLLRAAAVITRCLRLGNGSVATFPVLGKNSRFGGLAQKLAPLILRCLGQGGSLWKRNVFHSNQSFATLPFGMPDSQEEQLKLYRLLVEHSLGLMCIHDLEGVLLSINPAAAEALGYTPQECLGRSIRDLLVPAVQPLFEAYLQRIRTNPSDSGLMRLRAKDGTERIWFYRNIRYDEPGAAPRVLGHATDLTERIRAERALKAAQTALQQAHDDLAARVAERTADLQRANEQLRAEMAHRHQVEEELLRARKLESLGVLAGGIAHDFNNFLTVIMGNVALAKAQVQAADPVFELLEQSAQACQRAASLASQLLTFGRGGAPVRRPASLARVVNEAVELVRTEAPASIKLDVAEDLWPATIDAEQIGRALHNVLLNAH